MLHDESSGGGNAVSVLRLERFALSQEPPLHLGNDFRNRQKLIPLEREH